MRKNNKFLFNKKLGFTLIELLVVISIIGLLFGVSLFALQGSKASARDARRKSDLEMIRSGIEMYKADCGSYPTSLGTILVGDDESTIESCLATNIYIASVPNDPQDPTRIYRYSSNGTTYEICSSLEGGGTLVTCGGSSNCGETCGYKVVNP